MCNNLALAGEMAAVCEALALGARLGLDPALLSGVFNASSARCWSSDSYSPAPVRRTTLGSIACRHHCRAGPCAAIAHLHRIPGAPLEL